MGEAKAVAVRIPPEKLKADLDFLFKTIAEVHPNMYAYISEEEFEPLRDKLYRQITQPMTRLELCKLIAPTVASLKSGHTSVFLPFNNSNEYTDYLKNGGKIFPLSLNWNGRKAILARNYSATKLPLGGTILKINGQDASKVIKRLDRYYAFERRDTFPWALERDKILRVLFWVEYGPSQSLDIRIKSIDGTINDYVVEMMTLDEIKTKEYPDKGRNSYRYLPGYKAFLITLDDWSDFGKIKEFIAFWDKVFSEIQEQGASSLIIDLRNNPGGDLVNVDVFLAYLVNKTYYISHEKTVKLSRQYCKQKGINVSAKMVGTFKRVGPYKYSRATPLRFDGAVYLLVGVNSTSASTAFAANIKHSRAVTIIGEEPAEPLTTYVHSLKFELPNTHLMMRSPCAIFVWPGSKGDGRGVIPNHEVRQSAEDLAKGVDTALQYVLDLIEHHQNSKKQTESR